MDREFYRQLADLSISGKPLEKETAVRILASDQIELLPLLNAAYEVRREFTGKTVKIHIITNAQNGLCPEDCHYCAQAKSSDTDIHEYPLKPDREILAEAKDAYEQGAFRYCMVFAGRGPSRGRVERLAQLVREIKSRYPLEVCVSAGLLDEAKAKLLKEAGLDRLNHNLNTSRKQYPKICTTHSYDDRLNTLQAARRAGLQLCSGVILGLGEVVDDVLETAYTLRNMGVESIPVNFFIPIEGAPLKEGPDLSPGHCLRALCLYRLLNPRAEIRVAAGRELHLRSMQVMALYPANSLFLDGYLNAKGQEVDHALQMIKDAGFSIDSDKNLNDLLARIPVDGPGNNPGRPSRTVLKSFSDLRPQCAQ